MGDSDPVTAREAESVEFNTSLRGYSKSEVDFLLQKAVVALRSFESKSGSLPGRLTALDTEQSTFTTTLKGYDLNEVDDFLDRVVGTLDSYESEPMEWKRDDARLVTAIEPAVETSSNLIDSDPEDISPSEPLSSEEILAQAKKWLE